MALMLTGALLKHTMDRRYTDTGQVSMWDASPTVSTVKHLKRTRLHWDFGQNSRNSNHMKRDDSSRSVYLMSQCFIKYYQSAGHVELWTHTKQTRATDKLTTRRQIPIWSQSTTLSLVPRGVFVFSDRNFSRPLFFDGGVATSVLIKLPR